MKKILTLFICFLMIFTLGAPAYAVQGGVCYYVDSVYGNDENEGTSPKCAWKTLERAGKNIFAPGDSLLLKRGQTFGGNFVTNGSGSEAEPVVFSAYGEGDAPVIHAGNGEFIFFIQNVSHWIFENFEASSDGFGAIITAHSEKNTEDITVRNCYFHDINPDRISTDSSAININNQRGKSKISKIHLDSVRIENAAWGVHSNGTNAETDKKLFVSPKESYNSDFLFENLYIKGAKCGGIVVSAVHNGTVRNCRVLDCATAQGEAYAPLWIRHSDGITVEYCEIAGSTNKIDGMAIDFDGWTVNSTYRYIYSHDNTRFMKNCVFDRKTKNAGNTVCNCVSVNDNKKMNWGAICLISTSRPSIGRMADFSFHDNIIVNGKPFFWLCTKRPQVENIEFIGKPFNNLIQRIFNMFVFPENFNYARTEDEQPESLIKEITANLPE